MKGVVVFLAYIALLKPLYCDGEDEIEYFIDDVGNVYYFYNGEYYILTYDELIENTSPAYEELLPTFEGIETNINENFTIGPEADNYPGSFVGNKVPEVDYVSRIGLEKKENINLINGSNKDVYYLNDGEYVIKEYDVVEDPLIINGEPISSFQTIESINMSNGSLIQDNMIILDEDFSVTRNNENSKEITDKYDTITKIEQSGLFVSSVDEELFYWTDGENYYVLTDNIDDLHLSNETENTTSVDIEDSEILSTVYLKDTIIVPLTDSKEVNNGRGIYSYQFITGTSDYDSNNFSDTSLIFNNIFEVNSTVDHVNYDSTITDFFSECHEHQQINAKHSSSNVEPFIFNTFETAKEYLNEKKLLDQKLPYFITDRNYERPYKQTVNEYGYTNNITDDSKTITSQTFKQSCCQNAFINSRPCSYCPVIGPQPRNTFMNPLQPLHVTFLPKTMLSVRVDNICYTTVSLIDDSYQTFVSTVYYDGRIVTDTFLGRQESLQTNILGSPRCSLRDIMLKNVNDDTYECKTDVLIRHILHGDCPHQSMNVPTLVFGLSSVSKPISSFCWYKISQAINSYNLGNQDYVALPMRLPSSCVYKRSQINPNYI